jgi:hypothetical protein
MVRTVVVVAGFALLGLAPAAGAVPRSCNVVTDARGDEKQWTVTGDGDLDVLSADVASNATYLTAVVRTASLRALDTDSPAGRGYQVTFRVGEELFVVFGATGPDGTGGYVAHVTPDAATGGKSTTSDLLGPVSTRLDLTRHEVVVTTPIGAFDPVVKIKKGTLLRDVAAMSLRHVGPSSVQHMLPTGRDVMAGGVFYEVDPAASSGRYVAGSPSCVTPGS